MNYFASCFYGDYEKYANIKSAAELRKDYDKLWILGDAISGDDPESSLRILNDISSDPCVELILGDHEYGQVMLANSESAGGSVYEEWEEYVDDLSPSGLDFAEYIKEELDPESREAVISFLESCEVTATVPIGHSHFYMVHGYPVFYKGDETIMEWQFGCTDTSGGQVRVDYFPWLFIRSDPAFSSALKAEHPATEKSTFAILGQPSPAESAAQLDMALGDTGVFFKNRMFSIGRKSLGDPVPLLAVDAATFYVKTVV